MRVAIARFIIPVVAVFALWMCTKQQLDSVVGSSVVVAPNQPSFFNDIPLDSALAIVSKPCEEVYNTSDFRLLDEYRFKMRFIIYKPATSVRKDTPLPPQDIEKLYSSVGYLNCVMDDVGFGFDIHEILVDTSMNKYANMNDRKAHMSLSKFIFGIDPMINIHIYPLSRSVAGDALTAPGNHAAIQSPFIMTSVFAHEVGHLFGLKHCHITDTTDGFNPYTGDQVCDTPSGPNMSEVVKKDCRFVDNISVKDTALLEILKDNYMGYAPFTCRTDFTEGQKKFMIWNVNNTPVLYLSLSVSGSPPAVVKPRIIPMGKLM